MTHSVKIIIPVTQREVEVPTGLFINNEFVPSVDSTELIQCVSPSFDHISYTQDNDRAINPATEGVICSVVAGMLFIHFPGVILLSNSITPMSSFRERHRYCRRRCSQCFQYYMGEKRYGL